LKCVQCWKEAHCAVEALQSAHRTEARFHIAVVPLTAVGGDHQVVEAGGDRERTEAGEEGLPVRWRPAR
jgi:hypothetical protein